ncbi:esterase, partial [Pseudomonas syringae pv. tagetis]
MSLSPQAPDIEALMAAHKKTIGEVLDFRFESFTDVSLTASMGVVQRTHEPFGLLHG